MQAITTKYHGPTDTRGSRISATSASGIRVYRAYDDADDSLGNHADAARQLALKLGWMGSYYAGSTADGYVFVHVYDDQNPEFTITIPKA